MFLDIWLALLLAAPEAGGDYGEEPGRLLAIVLKVVGQVGVEGDAVARGQIVASALDEQRQGAVEHHGGPATPRLVPPRVLATAGRGTRFQGVDGDVRALSGQRWRQLLEAMPPALGVAARAGAADGDVVALAQGAPARP